MRARVELFMHVLQKCEFFPPLAHRASIFNHVIKYFHQAVPNHKTFARYLLYSVFSLFFIFPSFNSNQDSLFGCTMLNNAVVMIAYFFHVFSFFDKASCKSRIWFCTVMIFCAHLTHIWWLT